MCAFIPKQQQNTGLYVPTTYIWDVAELYQIEVNSPEFKELLIRLYQNVNNMILSLNLKDTGLYQTQELVNGQVFFNPNSSRLVDARSCFRTLVSCGQLANTGTTNTPHGIAFTSTYTLTRMYGAATDPTGLNYIPLPYASPTAAHNIELNADGTNVNIITGSNRSNFTISYVVLEYLKN